MNTDWLIIPFIINLALLAFVRYNYSGYIKLILFSTINYQASNIIYKEYKASKPRSYYALFIIFFISSGIFILQLLQSFSSPIKSEYYLYLIPLFLFLFTILISLSKILNYISGKVFLQSEISSEYNNNINAFIQTLGIILVPITILISYTNVSKVFIYIGIIMVLIIYLLKIVRLFKINIRKQLNILYMFLYLCTLEIIPVLYIIKIFIIIQASF